MSARRSRPARCAVWLWLAALAACGDNAEGPPGGTGGPATCAGDTAGLTLPEGFCATVFATGLGRARQLAVTPSGDVLVAIPPPPGSTERGRVIALRDADRDGIAEQRTELLPLGGHGVVWRDGALFLAANDRIVRAALPDGALVAGEPEVLVSGLPNTGDHPYKAIAVAGDALYVNIGSASNACQVENRALRSPGVLPCTELATRAGVWRFSATARDQVFADGVRFATGVRNATALTLAPDGALWAAVNGRDQLHENWPERFTVEQDLVRPGEEIVKLDEGEDRGWPYCYHDPFLDDMVLAPEYGGDGQLVGRCSAITNPEGVLPAHWAPLGAVFYDGTQLPDRYRGGLIIANHGSRFDMNAVTDNPGYNVVYVPLDNGRAGDWEELAGGFTGGGLPLPAAAEHRPVGVAVHPDGSLLVSDDVGGWVWKISYAP